MNAPHDPLPPLGRARRLLMLLALGALALLPACGVVIDDRPWDVGPADDGGVDGAADDDDAAAAAAREDWPYDHDPEDCPELADDPPEPGDRPPADPRCDGVSHFFCSENPHDACCRGGGGGGSNAGDDGRNPGSSGGSGGGSGSGSGGGRPPDPRF